METQEEVIVKMEVEGDTESVFIKTEPVDVEMAIKEELLEISTESIRFSEKGNSVSHQTMNVRIKEEPGLKDSQTEAMEDHSTSTHILQSTSFSQHGLSQDKIYGTIKEEPSTSQQSCTSKADEIPTPIKEEPALEIDSDSSDSDVPLAKLKKTVSKKTYPPTLKKKYKQTKDKTIDARCNLCPYQNRYNVNLLNHFKNRHPGEELNVKYKCKKCDTFFKTTWQVVQHSKIEHQTMKTIYGMCKVCKYVAGARTPLVQHFRRMHPGVEYDFEIKCQECDEFFENPSKLRQHSLEKHNKHDYKSRCNVCKKVFLQYCILKAHFQRYHPGFEFKPDFKCTQCEEYFDCPERVTQHSKLPHESREQVKVVSKGSNYNAKLFQALKKLIQARCSICEMTCSNITLLKSHFERCHPDSDFKPDYKCIECQQFFPTPHDCFEHTKLQHQAEEKVKLPPERPRKHYNKRINARCMVCKSIFCTNGSLKKHYKYQHPGKEFKADYKCLHCDLFFESTFEARLHAKVEHQGKEITKMYEMCRCNVCKQLMAGYAGFRKHFEEYHPGFEPNVEFKCKWCENFFISLIDLNEHIQTAHPTCRYSVDKEASDYDSSDSETMQSLEDSESTSSKVSSLLIRKEPQTHGRCNKCTYQGNRCALVNHFKSKHPDLELDVSFKCQQCQAFFQSLKEVRAHVKVAHRVVRYELSRCKLCHVVFSSKSAMHQHYEILHPGVELDVEYKCQECTKFFNTKEELEKHTNVHDKHNFKSRCNSCGKIFLQISILRLHFEKYHPGVEFEPDYKCDLCDEFFKSTDEVREHTKLPHTQESGPSSNMVFREIYKKLVDIRCNLCKEVCNPIGSLQEHFKKAHPGDKLSAEYKCKDCDRCFGTPHDCANHSKVVHKPQGKEKPLRLRTNTKRRISVRCNVCGRMFNHLGSAKNHFDKNHTGCEFKPDFKCYRCDLFFESIQAVQLHAKVEHEGKVYNQPYEVCRCNVCKRTFVRQAILRAHFEEFHPGFELKPEFKCRWCEEFFNSLEDLSRHIRAKHPVDKTQTQPNDKLSIDAMKRIEQENELIWLSVNQIETNEPEPEKEYEISCCSECHELFINHIIPGPSSKEAKTDFLCEDCENGNGQTIEQSENPELISQNDESNGMSILWLSGEHADIKVEIEED